MSSPQIEPELLASFLDGTASPAERDAVLRTLSGSKRAYAEFLEASAIQQQLVAAESPESSAADTAHPAIDIASRRRRIGYVAPLVILAAASVIFVVTRRSTVRELDVVAIAQSTTIAGATGSGGMTRVLGSGWDEPGWTVTRGEMAVRDAAARAFRAGVRMAQLEVAASTRDSTAVAIAARQVQALLSDVPGSAPIAAQLGAIGSAVGSSSASDRAVLSQQLSVMVGDSNWFDLGMWAGTADIAAKGGQETFFAADGAAMSTLTQLLTRPYAPPDHWALVASPAQSLATGAWRTSGGITTLRMTLRDLLAAAGG